VLELAARANTVTGFFGRAEALDQLAAAAELCVRVAPDELLLIGEAPAQNGVLSGNALSGLVVDLTSGYACWALLGDDRFEAFRRLSVVVLLDPPFTAQGLVAQVPAKILVRDGEIVLLVSSVLSHHLRRRVLTACADLDPKERDVGYIEEGLAV
jgi:hypothetical protein